MNPVEWERVERIYQGALDQPPSERASFVETACGTDSTLRDEVLRSLAHTDAESPDLKPPRAVIAHRFNERRAQSLIGQTRGAYRINEWLGSGSMGEVYQATDTRLHREVALKVLPALSVTDSERVARFQREARVLAALSHPNICTIYDIDEAEGQPFIIMELMKGETLRERLARGPLPVLELIGCATQIADALAAAHRVGVVHRDVKPSNLFLTTGGRPKILDFGIAKTATQHDTVAQLTISGALLGTIAYMSPEQVRGEPLDPRSDLFSFGVVMYEMSTGARPFQGPTDGVVFDSILNRQPTPLEQRNPALPHRFTEIVRKALEKDRSRRYQSAAELRTDLSECSASVRELHRGNAWMVRSAIAASMVVGLTFLAFRGLAHWRSTDPETDAPVASQSAPTSIVPSDSAGKPVERPTLTEIRVPPAVAERIRQVLIALEEGYNRKDVEAVRRVFPKAPADLTAEFAQAVSLRYSLTNPLQFIEFNLNEGRALVEGSYSISVVTQLSSMIRTTKGRLRVALARRVPDGAWSIEWTTYSPDQ